MPQIQQMEFRLAEFAVYFRARVTEKLNLVQQISGREKISNVTRFRSFTTV